MGASTSAACSPKYGALYVDSANPARDSGDEGVGEQLRAGTLRNATGEFEPAVAERLPSSATTGFPDRNAAAAASIASVPAQLRALQPFRRTKQDPTRYRPAESMLRSVRAESCRGYGGAPSDATSCADADALIHARPALQTRNIRRQRCIGCRWYVA